MSAAGAALAGGKGEEETQDPRGVRGMKWAGEPARTRVSSCPLPGLLAALTNHEARVDMAPSSGSSECLQPMLTGFTKSQFFLAPYGLAEGKKDLQGRPAAPTSVLPWALVSQSHLESHEFLVASDLTMYQISLAFMTILLKLLEINTCVFLTATEVQSISIFQKVLCASFLPP